MTSWWQDAVFYQIYPRSFCDSNGDGVGDIQGIIEKVPYLKWLGIDAVWLSPIFLSPQIDGGYDISDYCAIDPMFGEMRDLEILIEVLHQNGMKLVLDGVFNHTSDQHPWFISSQRKEEGKAEWYIWRDSPNNWTSAFGGAAWTFCPVRQAYYLHTFASSQPDLNWRNPAVLEAVLGVQRFWYEKGVDGFRLDVFNAYVKDVQFQNNPRRWDVLGCTVGLVYGYVGQEHLYDRDRPELQTILSAFRELADEYDAVLMGETLDERFTYEKAKDYVGEGRLHLAFDFSPLHAKWTELPSKIEALSRRISHPVWVWSNHDFQRPSKRWGDHPNRARVMAVFQFLLKGTPLIYYGEELDQPEVSLRKSEIVDPVGRRFYPFYKGRDGARTPLKWDEHSNATAAWLPVRSPRNVQQSIEDPDSLLNLYKALIAFRQAHAVWRRGEIEWVEDGFYRHFQDERWFVGINWTPETMPIPKLFLEKIPTFSLISETGFYPPFGFAVWQVGDD